MACRIGVTLIRYLIVWIGFSIHRINYIVGFCLKPVKEKSKFYTLALLLLWHFPQLAGPLSVGKDALLALLRGALKILLCLNQRRMTRLVFAHD
jgi:hypothetical protein